MEGWQYIMKKRPVGILLFTIVIMAAFVFSACAQSGAGKEPIGEYIISDAYTYESFSIDALPSPSGIACSAGNLLVTDVENHCLVVLDQDMNPIQTIGKLGSAPLEFNGPTAIAINDDNYYILDNGNRRVQILNADFEYVDSVPLREEVNVYGLPYQDIAVDSRGTVYFSSGSPAPGTADVCKVEDGQSVPVLRKVSGFLTAHAGEVYFINKGEFASSKKGTILDYNAPCYLYREATGEKTDLPSALTAFDFVVEDSCLYCLTHGGARIQKLSLAGDYIETIADFTLGAESELKWCMTPYIASDGEGNFYTTNSDHGVIYKVTFLK